MNIKEKLPLIIQKCDHCPWVAENKVTLFDKIEKCPECNSDLSNLTDYIVYMILAVFFLLGICKNAEPTDTKFIRIDSKDFYEVEE
jgi:hypothetical protein